MKSAEHFLKQKTRASGRFSQMGARKTFTLAVALMLLLAAVANAATLTVTTASDDNGGVLSLRAAIARAFPGDTINFDESLAGQTIVLTQGQLTIDKNLTITGLGASLLTIDARPPCCAPRRVFEITQGAVVSISNLTIKGGFAISGFPSFHSDGGGGVSNHGVLNLSNCTVSGNRVEGLGGGIFNDGALTLNTCTVRDNRAQGFNGGPPAIDASGGGIFNRGTLTLINSTVSENFTSVPVRPPDCGPACGVQAVSSGGGIFNDGTLTLINSTVGGNRATTNGFGGGIWHFGTLTLINSTISGNEATAAVLPFGPVGGFGGGIFNSSRGGGTLQNTILAGNRAATAGDDCDGPTDSLGHNIIGSTANCAITLQSSDQQGDPQLHAFLDPGSPGNGRFPVQNDSPAIDAGDNTACGPFLTDQLGQPRSVAGSVPLDGPRICDIGAVEFYLPVNQLVSERSSERVTRFDPTPAPGAAAGTFLIIAKFDNISDTSAPGPLFANKTIFFPFVEVAAIQLSRAGAPPEDQPVLLNADGGPGRVGARLTPQGSLTTPFPPGATGTFQLLIGLQKREPFVLFVNLLGEPRSSVP